MEGGYEVKKELKKTNVPTFDNQAELLIGSGVRLFFGLACICVGYCPCVAVGITKARSRQNEEGITMGRVQVWGF
jgi:hypothetical protein